MRVAKSFLLVGMLLGGAYGCDSDDSSSGGGKGTGVVSGSPVAENEFAAAYARTYCQTVGGCCDGAKLAFDRSKCESTLTNELQAEIDKEKGKGRKYSPQDGGNCIATFKQYLGQCLVGADDDGVDDACENVFRGTTSEGGNCDSSSDCVAGLKCRPNESGKDVCGQPAAPLAEGGKCKTESGSYLQCATGLQCDYLEGVCKPLPKIGEVCTGSCVEGAYCPTYVPGTEVYCKATLPAGAECQISEYDSCGEGMECDDSHKCSPRTHPFTAEQCNADDIDF